MNFVAYEVKSNRKDINSATSQFDQVLQMQGVPLKKRPKQSEPSVEKKTPIETSLNLYLDLSVPPPRYSGG